MYRLCRYGKHTKIFYNGGCTSWGHPWREKSRWKGRGASLLSRRTKVGLPFPVSVFSRLSTSRLLKIHSIPTVTCRMYFSRRWHCRMVDDRYYEYLRWSICSDLTMNISVIRHLGVCEVQMHPENDCNSAARMLRYADAPIITAAICTNHR